MSETLSWIDSDVYISTGIVFASSAFLAFCENTTVNRQIGWVNTPAAGGIYHNHKTGQRADVTIAAAHGVRTTDESIFESQTACHLKFIYSAAGHVGGIYLYSGRLAQFNLTETNGQVAKYNLQGFFNSWSAF